MANVIMFALQRAASGRPVLQEGLVGRFTYLNKEYLSEVLLFYCMMRSGPGKSQGSRGRVLWNLLCPTLLIHPTGPCAAASQHVVFGGCLLARRDTPARAVPARDPALLPTPRRAAHAVQRLVRAGPHRELGVLQVGCAGHVAESPTWQVK